jgi:hypothetical protein
MPRISSFYGIVIWMYHDEIHHRGRPHFHASYGDDEVSIEIESLTVLAGGIPPRRCGWWSSGRVRTRPSCPTTGGALVNTSRFGRSIRSYRRSTIYPVRSTPLLLEATPLDGYNVHVRFEDGISADVDLSYLADYGGVFEPLRDPGYFRELRADPEAGTIVWPNDADIAPETLYAHAQRRAAATA